MLYRFRDDRRTLYVENWRHYLIVWWKDRVLHQQVYDIKHWYWRWAVKKG